MTTNHNSGSTVFPCRIGISLGKWESNTAPVQWVNVNGNLSVTQLNSIAVDPSDPNIIYSGEYGGYLTRFDRRTGQARPRTRWSRKTGS